MGGLTKQSLTIKHSASATKCCLPFIRSSTARACVCRALANFQLRQPVHWELTRENVVPHIPYTGVTFLRGYHHIGVEVWLQGFNYTQCNDVLPFEMCRFSVTCF